MGKRPLAYPFVPRSTARLVPGHLFSFPLVRGGYGCGQVVAGKWPYEFGGRTRFRAGLLDWQGPNPPTPADVIGCLMTASGWAHVGLFTEYGGLLIGEAPPAENGPGGAADIGMWGADGFYLFAQRSLTEITNDAPPS